LGLPAIHGLLLLNDPLTGIPTAILDAGPITAQRTAAVSGVAIRAFAPPVVGRPPRAALIGAGVQGGSHVPVIGHVLPGVELAIFDRDPDRASALAATARHTDGFAAAEVAASAHDAVDGADVVVTVAAFVPPPERQVMTNDWLAPQVLVVPELRWVPGPERDDRRGAGGGARPTRWTRRHDAPRDGARGRGVRGRDRGQRNRPRAGHHSAALRSRDPRPPRRAR
jgi:hypothetical protein